MLLLAADPRFVGHETGPGHPERPARLEAVAAGLIASGLGTDVVALEARSATRGELERVHPAAHLDRLEHGCAASIHFDADTPSSPGSWAAATAAAGAGLAAVEALTTAGGVGAGATGAFLAVRPPGHHARATQAMGFCLLNNVAIVARELRARGDRVAIVDIDAHHGNGTQDAFAADPRVLFVSAHQWGAGFYPGSGALEETGVGNLINLPFPAHTSGRAYRGALDEVVIPAIEGHQPTWLLISAGFDAHRADPITQLGLSAGDYADLIGQLLTTCPKTVAFLEGGYDFEALAACSAATIGALAGVRARPEPATDGDIGVDVVTRAKALREDVA